MSKKMVTAVFAAGSLALGLSGAAQAKSPVPGKPGTQNIVEIALEKNEALGVFDYLIGAATCKGQEAVVSILTGKDKVTLFAPTDTAFRNLLGIPQPADGEEEPSPEVFPCDAVPAETLTSILAYHVTDGRRFSNSVFNKNAPKMVEMLNGQYVVTNPDLTITGNGNIDDDGNVVPVGVVLPLVNFNASNGVIHVIDTVLLP
jgi:uncharacterized surface protein with fasciclin (FAS1) repeats